LTADDDLRDDAAPVDVLVAARSRSAMEWPEKAVCHRRSAEVLIDPEALSAASFPFFQGDMVHMIGAALHRRHP
jgi:hypothetical protein